MSWGHGFSGAAQGGAAGATAGFVMGGGPPGAVIGGTIGAVVGGVRGFFSGQQANDEARRDYTAGLRQSQLSQEKRAGDLTDITHNSRMQLAQFRRGTAVVQARENAMRIMSGMGGSASAYNTATEAAGLAGAQADVSSSLHSTYRNADLDQRIADAPLRAHEDMQRHQSERRARRRATITNLIPGSQFFRRRK